MASSVLDLVQKLDRAAVNLAKTPGKAVSGSLRAAKATMVAAGDAVNTPHTLHTSASSRTGKTGRGSAWGVRYLYYTKPDTAAATIFYWGAPPYWRERGIEPHEIEPRSGRGRKGRDALLANGLYFTHASHPGVGARPFWQPTKLEVANQTQAVFTAQVFDAIARSGLGHD